MTERRSVDFVQSLERGLDVLNSFSGERVAQTLSDVAKATGLTRATARRILLTLTELGYVTRSGKQFSLSPKVLDLGYSFLSTLRVVDLAQDAMERLVEEVKESSSMCILDGHDIVYVARVPTSRIMTISLALGSRLPAYPTSMGRVLLAGLSDDDLDRYLDTARPERLTDKTITDRRRLRQAIVSVRNEGYALVDQELEQGLRSVAAPVKNRSGEVIAALNLSFHSSRATVAQIRREHLPKLLATADEVSTRVRSLPVS